MKWISRFIGLGLGFVAILGFSLASFSSSIENALLSRDTYSSVFNNPDLFDELVPLALPAIFDVADEEDIQDFPIDVSALEERFSREDWRYITNELVPPAWLQARFEDGVDIVLGIINGDETILAKRFDFDEIRERHSGTNARETATYIIDNAPACTRTELDRIRSISTGAENTLPVCNPGDTYRDASISIVEQTFNSIAENLPTGDDNTVSALFNINERNMYVISLVVDIDAQVLLLAYICPLVLFTLIIFFAIRSVRDLGLWTAFVAIGSGILIMSIIVMMQLGALGSLQEIASVTNEVERLIANILANFATSATSQASSTLIIHAGIAFAVGFIALVVSILAPNPLAMELSDPQSDYAIVTS
jgi:hypothetical protein